MTLPHGLTTSLTLTGGGSYASYEVGVMAALFAGECPSTRYTPFDPDLLIGTSAGATNVLMLAALEVRSGSLLGAVAEMGTAWVDWVADGPNRCGNGAYRIRGLPFYLFDPACLRRGLAPFLADASEDAVVFLRGSVDTAAALLQSEEPPLRVLAESIDMSSLISTAPFLETLRTIVPLDDLDRSTRRLRVAAMDLTAGQLKLFNEDDVRRLGYQPLLASAALPVYFPPVIIEGRVYVNATTLASTPLLPAIQESDTMHIIYMDPDLSAISPIRLTSIIDAIDRLMVVNFAYMLNRDIVFAREINTALELMEDGSAAESLTAQDVHALLRSMARIQDRIQAGNPYRPLTIHRYHPRDDLGSNLGLMNLDHNRVSDMIQRGYDDAVAHDCVASGCLIPGSVRGSTTSGSVGRGIGDRPVTPADRPPFPPTVLDRTAVEP